MKILSLQVENIKRIRAIEIKPQGNTVEITGKNGNGKTSVLDSIEWALAGKKLIPEKPIRHGETTASIVVDMGEYKVTRHWTNENTSYLKLETAEGAQIKAPQKILDQIIGELSFDPLAFSTLEPAKRTAVLKDIVKVDFSTLDAEYSKLFAERTEFGRDIEKAKHRLENDFKSLPVVTSDDLDLEKIKAERKAAEDSNAALKSAKQNLENIPKLISADEDDIAKLEHQLKQKKESLNKLKKNLELVKEYENQELIDLSTFDARIEKVYEYKAATERMAERESLDEELSVLQSYHEKHTTRLDQIKQEKVDLIANAKMPIEGLTFGDGDISYNGIPFGQLSTAEQIKISMSMAIAMNPKLRVAFIHNGSLLDADAMKQVSEMAIANDMQVWIERVADTPDGNAIFIEDGALSEKGQLS